LAVASIHFEGVGKVFPDGTVALEDLDLDVEDGEFVVLVGPSGSGKSTALRILAGLEDARFASVYASGQAAATTVLSLLEPGQRAVTAFTTSAGSIAEGTQMRIANRAADHQYSQIRCG
jgi:ABC-type Fe3+/spermidine/putrescine transport system ATPase subunit